MLWGLPKVDPYTGSLHPLASFRYLALLDLIIGHVHWAPKVVPVLGVFLDVRLCKDGVRGSLVGIVKPGLALMDSFAILVAYGHRLRVMALGYLVFACIMEVLAISCRCRMRTSAFLFWW